MDWQTIIDFFGSEAGAFTVRALRIGAILLAAWLLSAVLSRLIRRVRLHLSQRMATPEQVKRAETLGRVFRYALSVIVTLVAGVLVLSELGISVAPILGAAGVVGLAIGFGAQNLVKDYFTGLFLLLENQISTGDVVTVAGLTGAVEDITLRHVRLRDYSGHVHYVSNGLITTVTNLTHDYAYAVVDVGVAYRENVDAVIEVMHEVGAALGQDPLFTSRILGPMEIAGVESLGDSSVMIRGRFKVRGAEQWTVRREYLRRIKAAFDSRGIEIPFPHLTVQAQDARAAAALLPGATGD